MNKLFIPAILLIASASSAYSSSIAIQNINSSETAGYALFDSAGTLLPDTLTDNIRVGFFNDGFDAAASWATGDLTALNTNFNTYGAEFGIFTGFDGGFQAAPTDTDASFSSKDVTLWVSSNGSFSDTNAEYLIYTFSAKSFPADEVNGSESIILGEDAGSFLAGAGEFGNFNHDFGFGGGSLPGFNTVSVVPEPSAYAAIAGFLALGWVMLRRRG